MTKEQREQARAICEAATPGEWVTPPTFSGICSRSGDILIINRIVNTRDADMRFIAHARTALPAALDYIEQLEAERDGAERAFQAEIGKHQMTETDRDHWKARAEALERATRRSCKLCMFWCRTIDCKYALDGSCTDHSNWQFDQARFTDKPTPCQDESEAERGETHEP